MCPFLVETTELEKKWLVFSHFQLFFIPITKVFVFQWFQPYYTLFTWF